MSGINDNNCVFSKKKHPGKHVYIKMTAVQYTVAHSALFHLHTSAQL